mmetsp:Transcript_5617/g.15702  ORF Transcript_5617/g.15702 Transcript_5617/m.15702 type:complete len:106 (+) Transcript_5617:1643-1960(+)
MLCDVLHTSEARDHRHPWHGRTHVSTLHARSSLNDVSTKLWHMTASQPDSEMDSQAAREMERRTDRQTDRQAPSLYMPPPSITAQGGRTHAYRETRHTLLPSSAG